MKNARLKFWILFFTIPLTFSIIFSILGHLYFAQFLTIYIAGITAWISIVIFYGSLLIALIDNLEGSLSKEKFLFFFNRNKSFLHLNKYESILNAISSHVVYIFVIIIAVLIYLFSIYHKDSDISWNKDLFFKNTTYQTIFIIESTIIIAVTLFSSLTTHYYARKTSSHIKRIQDFYINLRDIAAKIQEMFKNATEDIRIIATIPVPGLLTLFDINEHWISVLEEGKKDYELMGLDAYYTKGIIHEDEKTIESFTRIVYTIQRQQDNGNLKNRPEIKMILQNPYIISRSEREEKETRKDIRIEHFIELHEKVKSCLKKHPSQEDTETQNKFSNMLYNIDQWDHIYDTPLSKIYHSLRDNNLRYNMKKNIEYLGRLYFKLFCIAHDETKLPLNFKVAFSDSIPFLLYIVDNKALFTPLGNEWFKHVVLNETFLSSPDYHFYFDDGNNLLFGIYTEDKKFVSVLKEVFNRYFSIHYRLKEPVFFDELKQEKKIQWEYCLNEYNYFSNEIEFKIAIIENGKDVYKKISKNIVREESNKILFESEIYEFYSNLKRENGKPILKAYYTKERPEYIYLTS